MGFEGANVIFDTWVHPLMMGLEEHLLHMFRDDFEFADGNRAERICTACMVPTAAVAGRVGRGAASEMPEPATIVADLVRTRDRARGGHAAFRASAVAAPPSAPSGPAPWLPDAERN
jgi:light-independent protochlorophyllide reductase subunit B